MELQNEIINLIKQIERPDVLAYIYQIVIDIFIEINPETNQQAS